MQRLMTSQVVRRWCLILVLAILTFYAGRTAQPLASDQREANPVSARGEVIYVPIYSSIFYEDGKQTLELAATLSLHNVNLDRRITVTRADYYNTKGTLIKKYVEKPVELNPLQTMNIVVERTNNAGGTGANFVVEWLANQEVNSPLAEAVMVNASSNLGIAFTSPGKVIKTFGTSVK